MNIAVVTKWFRRVPSANISPIDRAHLAHRCATVVAKWSRSPQRTCDTFGTIFARRNFFSKKYTYAGSIVDTIFPACSIYYFTLKILQSSTQKYYNAEDTALLYYIEAHKKTEKGRSENRKVRLLLCLGHYKAHDNTANQARRPDNNTDRHRGNKENSRDSHHRSHQ
mgnify:FL=1